MPDSTPSPADLTPGQEWMRDQTAAAVARFDASIPPLYRPPVPMPAEVAAWAALGRRARGLAIVGKIGRGKTHLAWHAARAWLHAWIADPDWHGNPQVVAHRATELLDRMRPDTRTDPYLTIERAKNCDLLFLDDLAAARPNAWTQERFYEIVDDRYIKALPILLTADVPPAKFVDWLGPRTAPRLGEMCTISFLDGPDRRLAAAR